MGIGRCASILLAVGFAATNVGCSGAAAKPGSLRTAERNRQSSFGVNQPVTYTDKEQLMTDTGPVDDDAPEEFTETGSGLKYRILRKSDDAKATANDSVTVNYRGWLDDGTEFDSSYERGEPISFPLGGVIAGWTEGMQLVGTGGMIELTIPSELGYGSRGAGGAVPPNATLHFIVELISVN